MSEQHLYNPVTVNKVSPHTACIYYHNLTVIQIFINLCYQCRFLMADMFFQLHTDTLIMYSVFSEKNCIYHLGHLE